jgi:hypothetical protein
MRYFRDKDDVEDKGEDLTNVTKNIRRREEVNAAFLMGLASGAFLGLVLAMLTIAR